MYGLPTPLELRTGSLRRRACCAIQRPTNMFGKFLLAAVALFACAGLFPVGAKADALGDVHRRGTLRWGADEEGGGPYVYPRENDPDKVTGFEVEIADRVAAYLGVKAEFTQGQWDTMPEMLRTQKIDVLINGYELTPERLKLMDASIPYYVYRMQLLVRKGDSAHTSWESFKRAGHKGGRIGVLTGSAAETYARRFCNAGGMMAMLARKTERGRAR